MLLACGSLISRQTLSQAQTAAVGVVLGGRVSVHFSQAPGEGTLGPNRRRFRHLDSLELLRQGCRTAFRRSRLRRWHSGHRRMLRLEEWTRAVELLVRHSDGLRVATDQIKELLIVARHLASQVSVPSCLQSCCCRPQEQVGWFMVELVPR